MSRTWQDNAEEFKQLDTGVGWAFARLVACSVSKRKRGNQPKSTFVDLKTSAADFARRAGTNDMRVARYLDAWDAAAAEGHCRPSSELTPDDAATEPMPTIQLRGRLTRTEAADPEPQGNVVPAKTESPPVQRRHRHHNLTPEEQAVDDAEFEEGAKQLVRETKAKEAAEREYNSSAERGKEFQDTAIRGIRRLYEYGHYDRLGEVYKIVEILMGRLTDQLTPEMFMDPPGDGE